MSTLPTSSIARFPDYEKFEVAFQRAYPRPRSRAQVSNWTFKKKMAWGGWQMARSIPYVEPKSSPTGMVFKAITPEALTAMARL